MSRQIFRNDLKADWSWQVAAVAKNYYLEKEIWIFKKGNKISLKGNIDILSAEIFQNDLKLDWSWQVAAVAKEILTLKNIYKQTINKSSYNLKKYFCKGNINI